MHSFENSRLALVKCSVRRIAGVAVLTACVAALDLSIGTEDLNATSSPALWTVQAQSLWKLKTQNMELDFKKRQPMLTVQGFIDKQMKNEFAPVVEEIRDANKNLQQRLDVQGKVDEKHFHGDLMGYDRRKLYNKQSDFSSLSIQDLTKGELKSYCLFANERNDGSGKQVLQWSYTGQTSAEKAKAHTGYCFNSWHSDALPMDRDLPDKRHGKCKADQQFVQSLEQQGKQLQGQYWESKFQNAVEKIYGTNFSANADNSDVDQQNQNDHKVKPVSVIFVFYNELFSALTRSIISVLNRTPRYLLNDIVVVDDGSDLANHKDLAQKLNTFIEFGTVKTRFYRLPERKGLMAARMHGALKAKAPYLIFLDTHIEVNVYWMEPLLQRMFQDYKNVVVPNIDSIDSDSMVYSPGGLGVLGFTWKLGQTPISGRPDTSGAVGTGMASSMLSQWYDAIAGSSISSSDNINADANNFNYQSKGATLNKPSPIMAGGLFGISKKFFIDELEGYDAEMELYGGEEMEISFKIWQCGGKLELVPCSKVGHIFRSPQYWQGKVFSVESWQIFRNKLRAAEGWMDHYAEVAKISMSPLPEGQSVGDLTPVRRVREKLKCKDFNWYLKNVYPELWVPKVDNAVSGVIVNKGQAQKYIGAESICFDTLGANNVGEEIGIYPCHSQHGTQWYLFDQDERLFRVAIHDFTKCLTVMGVRGGTWNQLQQNLVTKQGLDQKVLDGLGLQGLKLSLHHCNNVPKLTGKQMEKAYGNGGGGDSENQKENYKSQSQKKKIKKSLQQLYKRYQPPAVDDSNEIKNKRKIEDFLLDYNAASKQILVLGRQNTPVKGKTSIKLVACVELEQSANAKSGWSAKITSCDYSGSNELQKWSWPESVQHGHDTDESKMRSVEEEEKEKTESTEL